MNITPLPGPMNQVANPTPMGKEGTDGRDLRRIRMNVNRTPGYEPQQAQVQELPPAQLSNSTNNENQAEEVDDKKPLSPQFAALAKQKRALQVKEREIAEREKALQTPGSGTNAVEVAKIKSDPLGVLLDAGVTYEQLTEQILANQGRSEFHALNAKIESLEKGFDQKLTEREQQQEKQVLAEMRREASLLASQGDDYELVRGTNSISDVMQLIERNYRETGEVLDVREALSLVEDELLKEAQRLTGFKKLQSQQQQAQPQMVQRGMRTLTNRDTASVPLSAKARALAAFRGELKR